MGSLTLLPRSSLALFVAFGLLHCALLQATGGAATGASSSPTSPATTSAQPQSPPAAGGPNPRRAHSAPTNVGHPGQKKALGKAYGPYGAEEGYEHHHGYGEPGYGGKHHDEGYGGHQEHGYEGEHHRHHHEGGYGGGRHHEEGAYGEDHHREGGYGGGEGHGYGHHQKGYAPPSKGYEHKGYEKEEYGPKHHEHKGYGHEQKKESYAKEEYGPFQFHRAYGQSYDTHYCSVHGSFSLALSHHDYEKKNEVYGHKKDEGYGEKKEGYGEHGVDTYGKAKHNYKPRFHTRQYCRYAAAASERSCRFCCRVVARSSNTSPDDIVAAIFNFDPIHPTANHVGFEHHEHAKEEEEGYGGKTEDGYGAKKEEGEYGKNYDYGGSAFQCVCCAPKHDSYKKK